MTQEPLSLLPANQPDLVPRQIVPHEDILVDQKEFDGLVHETDGKNHCYRSQLTQQTFGQLSADSGATPSSLVQNIASIPEIKRMQYLYTFGFDDGEYLLEVLDRLPQSSTLLCIEPWPELFYKVCATKDVSKLLADPRFDIILGQDPSITKLELTTNRVAHFEHCAELKRPHPYLRKNLSFSELQKKIMTLMLEAIKMKAVMKRTSDLSVKWYLENTPNGLRCGDVKHLMSVVDGKPYIAVGMGPSLDTQISLLKQVQGKAIIAVTDNALREQLDAGVDPDIVFHVEWRIESLAFYQDLKFRKPAVLCYLQGVHPKIMDEWPFAKVAYPASHVEMIFSPLTQDIPLPAFHGTTVGDFAIQFGAYANASEVYLLGMDASCPAGSYHHPNTAAMRELYGETNRFWSLEKWDWTHVYHEPQRVLTENWFGEKVYSHASFKKSLAVLATISSRLKSHQKMYSTSDYGAKLDAELRPLNSLMDYPDIDKTCQPSQNLVKNSDVQSQLKIRRRELRRYYTNIKDLKFAVKDYLEAAKEDSSRLEHAKGHYLRVLNSFQSDGNVAWVEKFVILLDGAVAIRSGRDRHRLRDETEEGLFHEKAIIFSDYIECMLPYEDVIKNHLQFVQREFSDGE